MAVDPLVTHKDPNWWRRAPIVSAPTTSGDLCDSCGHVRWLHVIGCTAASTSLVGDPDPCPCDKRGDQGQWRAPVVKLASR